MYHFLNYKKSRPTTKKKVLILNKNVAARDKKTYHLRLKSLQSFQLIVPQGHGKKNNKNKKKIHTKQVAKTNIYHNIYT